MFVPGPGAQIVRPNIYQTRGTSPTDNSIIKRFAKVIRKDRNDIDAKHSLRSQISNLKSLHTTVVGLIRNLTHTAIVVRSFESDRRLFSTQRLRRLDLKLRLEI